MLSREFNCLRLEMQLESLQGSEFKGLEEKTT